MADELEQSPDDVEEATEGDVEEIVVEVGDPSLDAGFVGRWLVAPTATRPKPASPRATLGLTTASR